MKLLLLVTVLLVSLESFAQCTGSRYCTVCTNCSRCRYCKGGGSCGVCGGGTSYTSNWVSRKSYKAPSSKSSTNASSYIGESEGHPLTKASRKKRKGTHLNPQQEKPLLDTIKPVQTSPTYYEAISDTPTNKKGLSGWTIFFFIVLGILVLANLKKK